MEILHIDRTDMKIIPESGFIQIINQQGTSFHYTRYMSSDAIVLCLIRTQRTHFIYIVDEYDKIRRSHSKSV